MFRPRNTLIAAAFCLTAAAASQPSAAAVVEHSAPRDPAATYAATLAYAVAVDNAKRARFYSYLHWLAILHFAALVEAAQRPPWTIWDQLAQCESSGDWSANTGNGYFGGLQWLVATFHSAGGRGMPHHASREEQIRVAENLLRMVGGSYRSQWPGCSHKLGLS